MSCREHHEGCGGHDHSHDVEEAIKESLLTKIDIENVTCMNEVEEGSIKDIFKPWEERLDTEKYVESDVDEQLLVNIPFTGLVKLKSLILRGGPDLSPPNRVKLYINKDMDFAAAEETEPVQEIELVSNYRDGVVEYPLRVSKFNNVQNLILFFPDNFGTDATMLYYLGFKGDFFPEAVVTVYELRPNVADHKVPGIGDQVNHFIG